MENNVATLDPGHDSTPATKADVESMITRRLSEFHRAMIERGQIYPIPVNPEDRKPRQS